ncbi:outer membrane lipoprotein-sorting protein [Kitasatospora sp. MAP12-15]|uniref:LolA family protein n=1 Tax=unclassified Kitasatospora TaxID=2633591 RepID=UPI002476D2B2|nr:DUF2092 domain-containing protein [Kitasatospora sp. MAP12-44]MDH6112398.1 outer membrane lipoprotein-sorting protein [Kitasatospora sp. MAP12-44]
MTEYAGFEGEQGGEVYRSRRRAAMRLLVPVAVAAVAVAGVNLVPALASDGSPTLPQLTAEQLIAKALGSNTQQLSGTVQVSTDLGIPAQVLDMVGHGGGAAAEVAGTAGAAGGSGQAQQRNSAAADPEAKLSALLAGSHTLRVAVDGPDKQRVALVESLAEYDVIHNGNQLWAYDSESNQALHLTAPQNAAGAAHRPSTAPRTGAPHTGAPLTGVPTTPQEAARQFLAQSADSSTVVMDGTATVAGRSAYELSVKPKQSGSTISQVRIAVDSATGTPLAVVATGASGNTILDMHFSDVSFGAPSAKTFDFTPPKGATVTQQTPGQDKNAKAKTPRDTAPGKSALGEPKLIGTDWTTVVSFQLPSDEGSAALSSTAQGRKGRLAGGLSSSALLKSLGKPVAGGTLISTQVVNVLITDSGRVYAGAVTLPVLQNAAGVK